MARNGGTIKLFIEEEIETMPYKNIKDNVVPACQSCNDRKGIKILERKE